MKAPLLHLGERIVLRILPETLGADFIRRKLAVARFKQAFGKSWLIQKLVKPLVENLSKRLSP